MRNWSSHLVFLLLIAAPCLGQSASVNVNANGGACKDCRPFGKYLAEICTISGDIPTLASQRKVTCSEVPYPGSAPPNPQLSTIRPKDQTITIKLVCDPAKKTACDPPSPKIGSDFFVAAKTDSGSLVQQAVLQGSVTPLGGSGTVEYRTNGPGPIIIRATAPATSLYTAAAPVDLILQASADASASDSCAVLPTSPAISTPLDASTIVSLLGNPTPFILAAQGPNSIAIYSTRQPLRTTPVNEYGILHSFQDAIAALAGRAAGSLGIPVALAKPFSVELKIPHAAALGDLATRIGGLNYSQFTVQDVGRNWVRVTSPTQPDCETWKGFLTDIREMAWQVVSTPMSNKLYYLSSSDVATAFSSLAPAAASAPPAATAPAAATSASSSPTTPAAASATPSSTTSAPPSGTAASAASPPTAGATSAPSGAVSSNATIAIAQPPGSNIQINSDTTPCVVTGLAFGNATACGSSLAATPAAAPAAAPAAQSPLAMASMAVAAGIGEQTPPDLLVYSDTNPGDDAQIAERNRVIAQLDLPRPEMILTAWMTQNSSASPQASGAFNNMVKGLVADYDHEFESVVLTGWQSVKEQSTDPESYFNEPFRSYIADRFVADTSQPHTPGSGLQELSQTFLDSSQVTMADPVYPTKRTDLGICERKRYCLGYTSLFNPLKPALTDLLLTIIAAQDPIAVTDITIRDVEGPTLPADDNICATAGAALPVNDRTEVRKRCRAIWRNLDIDTVTPRPQPRSCEERDFRGILGSLLNVDDPEPRVHLQCFQQQAHLLFRAQPASGGTAPYGVGLLRAAIADFLFTYKTSQEYPHEFVPYDLTQTANALNYTLSPLIDAFNRDLWSYQLFMRADMQYRAERLNMRTDDRCCVKRLFGLDKPSFFNDGLVTVRTISGQPTTVSTTTQSFLNGSTAPELSALLNSIAGATTAPASPAPSAASGTTTTTTTTTTTSGGAPTPAASGGAAPVTTLGKISGILANYQTTFAQIGRQLSFSATPRSLATASSAEISVTLNADESAGGPLYTGPGATDPAFNTSRVANHDTTTRVRVDSIKLFEVSSFSAIVERSRSRFPLLPPFVEIPYIGTFAGIPLGSAKEFHSSTAIISAYVVPTAADVAYGLRFVSDLVVDGPKPGRCSFFKGAAGPDVENACVFRRALSQRDFGGQPIREFNRRIARCFATDTTATGCGKVSFDNVATIP